MGISINFEIKLDFVEYLKHKFCAQMRNFIEKSTR